MKAKDLLHIYASIGDMKLVDYKNTLAVAALIRLLETKGVFSEEEFRQTAQQLDATSPEPTGNTVMDIGQERTHP